MRDYYEILGVPRTATHEDLHDAYRALARRYHPDVNPGPDAAGEMQVVNAAWAVLGDPDERARYDRSSQARVDRGLDIRNGCPPGFMRHPRVPLWGESRMYVHRIAYDVADEVHGGLSLVAESEDLSGLDQLGDDDVWLLDLSRPKITDAHLRAITRFSRLEVLNVADTKVTDAGMATVAGFPLLQNLDVSHCKITDRGVEALAALARLEILSLFGTRVTDDVIPFVARLPRLMVLDLRDTKIKGKSLDLLIESRRLAELRIPPRARGRAVTLAAARRDITVL